MSGSLALQFPFSPHSTFSYSHTELQFLNRWVIALYAMSLIRLFLVSAVSPICSDYPSVYSTPPCKGTSVRTSALKLKGMRGIPPHFQHKILFEEVKRQDLVNTHLWGSGNWTTFTFLPQTHGAIPTQPSPKPRASLTDCSR